MTVVAHCCWITSDGLISPFVVSQICGLKRFRSVVFTLDVAGREAGAAVFGGVAVYAAAVDGLRNRLLRHLRGYSPAFDAAVRQCQPAILHAHFGPYGIAFLSLAQRHRLPLVTSVYGYDISALPQQERYLADLRRLFRHGQRFLAEGSHAARTLVTLGCPEDRIVVHPIGIELARFPFAPRTPPDGEVRFLMCNRLVEKKGIPYALQALARVAADRPEVRLDIVGDGPLRAAVEATVARLGLQERVRLRGNLGYADYVRELYDHHILVAPSIVASDGNTEGGAPTVLLEAQASGMPIVATRHADIPEVVAAAAGLLVPERDVAALAEAMAYLADNPDVWVRMGAAGRQHVERRHDIIAQNARLEDLYSEVIAESRKER